MKIIKRTVIMALMLVCYWTSVGQFYDRSWLVGAFPTIKLSFQANTLDTITFNNGVSIAGNSAFSNISDTLGEVLFLCNGSQIGGRLSPLMENGDTLTDSIFYYNFPSGFSEPQTNLILPRSNNTFYVFYYSESDSLYALQTIAEPDRLYYAVVDMNANGGAGKVVSKKNITYKGLFGDCRLTACRHANGRDWWMVHQGYMTNKYFIYLVTPDSVFPPHFQNIGPTNFQGDNLGAQSCFSPDGSKFATICPFGPLVIMDFDRCTGTFSNPDSIYMLPGSFRYNGSIIDTAYSGGSSCAFSSNGQYLYTSGSFKITQYDVHSTNIQNSAIEIGRWDSTGAGGAYLGFYQIYLLPNGKLIIDDIGGTGREFHLIDSPDNAGTSCRFRFKGLPTNTLNADVLPNMINYRLGALRGSGCDTITGIADVITSSKGLKIYPNPATEYLTVSLLSYHQNAKLYVYDAIGREVYRKENMYLDQEIDVRKFPSGVYSIQIISDDGDMSGRFVKE